MIITKIKKNLCYVMVFCSLQITIACTDAAEVKPEETVTPEDSTATPDEIPPDAPAPPDGETASPDAPATPEAKLDDTSIAAPITPPAEATQLDAGSIAAPLDSNAPQGSQIALAEASKVEASKVEASMEVPAEAPKTEADASAALLAQVPVDQAPLASSLTQDPPTQTSAPIPNGDGSKGQQEDKVVRYVLKNGTKAFSEPSKMGTITGEYSKGTPLLVTVTGDWAMVSSNLYIPVEELSAEIIPRYP